MPKISELEIANALDVNNDDLLVIVDRATSTTRQLPIREFAKVIANILNINIENDAGGNLAESVPDPIRRTCGTMVSRDYMPYKVLVDEYEVTADSVLLELSYNTFNIGNRITVVGESASGAGIKLYDTGREISTGNATINISICKPLGINTIKVYIRSEALASYEYVLTCTTTACDYVPTITPNITPTCSATPPATPDSTPNFTLTPTPTVTPTPSATSSA